MLDQLAFSCLIWELLNLILVKRMLFNHVLHSRADDRR